MKLSRGLYTNNHAQFSIFGRSWPWVRPVSFALRWTPVTCFFYLAILSFIFLRIKQKCDNDAIFKCYICHSNVTFLYSKQVCLLMVWYRTRPTMICFEIFKISSKRDIRSGLSYEQIAFWEILNFDIVKCSLKATKTPQKLDYRLRS